MIDLGREMAQLVRVDWSPARSLAAEAGLRNRRQRRQRARLIAGAAIAAAIVVWATWPAQAPEPAHSYAWQPPIMPRPAAPAVPPAVTPATPPAPSVADATPPLAAEPPVVAPPPAERVIALAGARRFETAEQPLRVVAGDATIVAFSATFLAAHYQGRLRVEVFSGTVTVASRGRHRELAAGQTEVFPARAKQPPPPPAAAKETWRDLAARGQLDQAYAALAASPHVRDVAEELLLAADVNRLSHHPAEAVAPLRQIVRDHAADPRAPLAAFTLGRVLLEELARPHEAAEAFAQADALAPDGPLAQDAVARQVEALARSGDVAHARQIAELYVARFPDGRRLRSVRRWGGL